MHLFMEGKTNIGEADVDYEDYGKATVKLSLTDYYFKIESSTKNTKSEMCAFLGKREKDKILINFDESTSHLCITVGSTRITLLEKVFDDGSFKAEIVGTVINKRLNLEVAKIKFFDRSGFVSTVASRLRRQAAKWEV